MKYLAFILALASPSFAQIIPYQRIGTDQAFSAQTTTQFGDWVGATISNWTDQVAQDPSIVLTRVLVSTPVFLRATVTVRNTSQMTTSGQVNLFYSYFSTDSGLTWGPSDGSGPILETIPVTDLAPGEVRTLPAWTGTPALSATFTPGGFWEPVANDCTGFGKIPFAADARVQIGSVSGAGLEFVSADLEACVSGVLVLDMDLGPSSDADNFCPAQVNSSGAAGSLSAFGVAAPTSPFVVIADNLPASTFAVLFINESQAMVPTVNGTICIGGARLYRSNIFVTPAAPGGSVLFDVDLGNFTSGSTVWGQAFFREPQGFSVTDALEIAIR